MKTPQHRTMVERFTRAHVVDPAASRWYVRAADDVDAIATAAGLPFDTVCGMVAALSPRLQWRVNLRYADVMARTGDCPGLTRSRAAAARILLGESPADVLRGPKTAAFHRALSGDTSAAVVDVWMLRAAGWPTDSVTRARYADVARALAAAAARAGSDVAPYQAEVWTAVRGRAG